MRTKVSGVKSSNPVVGHARFEPNLPNALAMVRNLYFLARVNAQEARNVQTILFRELRLSAKV